MMANLSTDFRTLATLLSADADGLEKWLPEAIDRIAFAKRSMSKFVEEYGDGEGYEDSVGSYWTLDMGETFTFMKNTRHFWEFVAFDELLSCEPENLLFAADDAEEIWADISDSFASPEELALDSEIFKLLPNQYLPGLQEKLNKFYQSSGSGDSPCKIASLLPHSDGAKIFAALVRENEFARTVEAFSRFGVTCRDPVRLGRW